MERHVELETEDGHILVFEAEPVRGTGYAPASADDTPLRRRFGEAFDDLGALASALTGKLREQNLRPDQIEVTVGVKMTAEAGIVFARSGGEGALNVKLVWKTASSDG